MKKRTKFSLRILLCIIAVISCALGYVVYHRERGVDALHYALDFYGAEDEYIEYETYGRKLIPPLHQRLLGNTKPVVGEISIRLIPEDGLIGALAKNEATDRITTLRFHPRYASGDTKIESHHDCFFKSWKSLERIVFRDTVIPASWKDGLQELPALEEIVISGAYCNLEPEELVGIPSLKKLVFCHRGINSQRLAEIRSLLPDVQVNILGSHDCEWDFSKDKDAQRNGLSKHDPEAYQEMKKVVDQLNEAIKSFDTKAPHHAFNPPASADEIAELELKLGVPLPKYARAFLEVANGWDEGYLMWELMKANEIAENYEDRKEIGTYDYSEYDFEPYYDHYSNPNVIPMGRNIGVSVLDGSVWALDDGGESGPWSRPKIKNLKHYFELMRLEIENSPLGEICDAKYGLELPGNFWWDD